MSVFRPSDDYLIYNTTYQIFIEEDTIKKQYLLELLNYYNQYKYFTEEKTYNLNKELPLPTPPIKPQPPNNL